MLHGEQLPVQIPAPPAVTQLIFLLGVDHATQSHLFSRNYLDNTPTSISWNVTSTLLLQFLPHIPLKPCYGFILLTRPCRTNTPNRPTFIFLKGSTKVDQVRGANKRLGWIFSWLIPCWVICSELENTIKKHATTSSTAAFSGKGQTLGGDPAAPDVVGEVKGAFDSLSARFSELNPQAKVLLGLLGLYFVFWFF